MAAADTDRIEVDKIANTKRNQEYMRKDILSIISLQIVEAFQVFRGTPCEKPSQVCNKAIKKQNPLFRKENPAPIKY